MDKISYPSTKKNSFTDLNFYYRSVHVPDPAGVAYVGIVSWGQSAEPPRDPRIRADHPELSMRDPRTTSSSHPA